jgi:hypothetical protein
MIFVTFRNVLTLGKPLLQRSVSTRRPGKPKRSEQRQRSKGFVFRSSISNESKRCCNEP